MQLAVFTDLDGTLLDHSTYSFEAALPAINALKQHNIPLVLASSKTAAEIAEIHGALELGSWPAIVENGSGLFDPDSDRQTGAAEYDQIRAALDDLPATLRQTYRGFGDMSDQEVAETTGLPLESARLARKRRFSEPGLWSGSDELRQAFLEWLRVSGISARQGGRFLTLSLGKTKADRMQEVADRFSADTTIALGDAPNDIEMLQSADYGIVIKNDHSPLLPPLEGEAEGYIRRTDTEGPAAWNKALLGLLAELGVKQD